MKHFATVRRIENNRNGNPRYAVNFFDISESGEVLQVGPDVPRKFIDAHRAYVYTSYNIQYTIRESFNTVPSAQVVMI